MLRAPDDLILQILSQVVEVIAVTRHPHDQVLVLLGEFLCIPQGVGIDHVELDMMAVHPEIAADQLDRKSVV